MSVSVEASDELPAGPTPAPAPATTSSLVGIVMIGVCGLTPFLAYFSNLAFAPLAALAGLVCLPVCFQLRRPNAGVAILALLAVWAAVSMQWSIAAPKHPDFGHHKAGEQLTALKLILELALYGAFVLATLFLSRVASARALLVLAVGLSVMALLFMLDALSKGAFYQGVRSLAHLKVDPFLALRDMSRASYVLALLFWPVAIGFERLWMRIVAGAVVVATLIGSYVVNADAPFAAFAVSTVVFFAVRRLGRPALLVLLTGVVLYFLAAPLLIAALDHGQMLHPAADDIREQSWAARLDIWRFAGARINERPLFGWGLDAARMFSPSIPLHTHDGAMQVWLELGAVGAILACLFWSWIVVQIDRLEDLDRPAAAAVAAAASVYLTIGAISFGVWQEWWLALGALTAAVCIALIRARGTATLARD